MNSCENCECGHTGEYGSGRFCSLKCARSFSTKINRKEINEKLSNSLKKSKVSREANKRTANDLVRKEKFKKTLRDNITANLLSADFNTLNYKKKKQRIILEQNKCCNNCKNSKWLTQDIPLELEHIDGNNKNNKRENLKVLCPNCHALTSTWRGRNKKVQKFGEKKVSDEILLKCLIKHNWIIYRALNEVGLVPKGANYTRCKNLKLTLNLPKN